MFLFPASVIRCSTRVYCTELLYSENYHNYLTHVFMNKGLVCPCSFLIFRSCQLQKKINHYRYNYSSNFAEETATKK